jgi:DNA repair protein RadC
LRGHTLKAGDSSERKSTVCGITGLLSATADALPIISSTRLALKLAALAAPIFFPPAASALAFASKRKICNNIFLVRKRTSKYYQPPTLLVSLFSVQERLVTYGSEALNSIEHLGLIVGSQLKAEAMLQHFGSIPMLARASVEELLPFLSRTKALRLISSFRMSAVVLREERESVTIDSPLAIAELCSEMRFLDRESLRVVLLNAKQHLIKVATVSQGTVNESLAHPREIFKPAIVHSAYSFVMVHNHPSGDPSPSEADIRLTRRTVEAGRILQLQLIDHVIIGTPAPKRNSYFSFKEAGVIG